MLNKQRVKTDDIDSLIDEIELWTILFRLKLGIIFCVKFVKIDTFLAIVSFNVS